MSAPVCRAKFKLTQRNENSAGFSLSFEPVTTGSKENDEFFKWTPWGKVEIGTINPEAAKGFVVGGEYYLDFTPAT
jgi:hypothetical protein